MLASPSPSPLPPPCCLAPSRDNRSKLLTSEAGAIPLLVAQMCRSSDAPARQAAASALSNIACNCEETQRCIAEAGALPVLCEILEPGASPSSNSARGEGGGPSTGGSGGGSGVAGAGGCGAGAGQAPQQEAAAAAAARHDLGCREAAAWLLSNLACSPEVRQAIVKQEAPLGRSGGSGGGSGGGGRVPGAAPVGLAAGLVDLLRVASDSGRQAAARAIKNLAAGNNSGSYKVGCCACACPHRLGSVLAFQILPAWSLPPTGIASFSTFSPSGAFVPFFLLACTVRIFCCGCSQASPSFTGCLAGGGAALHPQQQQQ